MAMGKSSKQRRVSHANAVAVIVMVVTAKMNVPQRVLMSLQAKINKLSLQPKHRHKPLRPLWQPQHPSVRQQPKQQRLL
jgi:hypothetical protein